MRNVNLVYVGLWKRLPCVRGGFGWVQTLCDKLKIEDNVTNRVGPMAYRYPPACQSRIARRGIPANCNMKEYHGLGGRYGVSLFTDFNFSLNTHYRVEFLIRLCYNAHKYTIMERECLCWNCWHPPGPWRPSTLPSRTARTQFILAAEPLTPARARRILHPRPWWRQ